MKKLRISEKYKKEFDGLGNQITLLIAKGDKRTFEEILNAKMDKHNKAELLRIAKAGMSQPKKDSSDPYERYLAKRSEAYTENMAKRK
jgi:hypothetical protein